MTKKPKKSAAAIEEAKIDAAELAEEEAEWVEDEAPPKPEATPGQVALEHLQAAIQWPEGYSVARDVSSDSLVVLGPTTSFVVLGNVSDLAAVEAFVRTHLEALYRQEAAHATSRAAFSAALRMVR